MIIGGAGRQSQAYLTSVIGSNFGLLVWDLEIELFLNEQDMRYNPDQQVSPHWLSSDECSALKANGKLEAPLFSTRAVCAERLLTVYSGGSRRTAGWRTTIHKLSTALN